MHMLDCTVNNKLLLLHALTGQKCSFQYLSQPPSTTLQCCDPYDEEQTVSILLQCSVERKNNVSDQFMIKWFRENTTGAVKDLGLGDPVQDLGAERFLSSYPFNQPYSPSLLGKYWCQVIINTTADPDQPLMRSNVFTLLAPENYSGPTCSSIPGLKMQLVGNITCADEHTAMPPAPNGTTNIQSLMGNLSALHIVFKFTV